MLAEPFAVVNEVEGVIRRRGSNDVPDGVAWCAKVLVLGLEVVSGEVVVWAQVAGIAVEELSV